MLIDTHAHINFKAFREDGDEVIKRALDNNVWLINVGAEFKTSKRAVEYAKKRNQGVFAAVGLHPIHLKAQTISGKLLGESIWFDVKEEEFDYEKYKALAQEPKVVAIGEIGLDYYRRNEKREMSNEQKEKQRETFIKQLELAQEVNKPIIIHCREAYQDLLEILKTENLKQKTNLKGVIHSFLGNCREAREYRRLGFKIGFNGIITFTRDYDEVILETPLKDILLETDCPYLTPVPYRGKRNEPLYVAEVAKKLAEIKNLELKEVIEQTFKNAREVFNI